MGIVKEQWRKLKTDPDEGYVLLFVYMYILCMFMVLVFGVFRVKAMGEIGEYFYWIRIECVGVAAFG